MEQSPSNLYHHHLPNGDKAEIVFSSVLSKLPPPLATVVNKRHDCLCAARLGQVDFPARAFQRARPRSRLTGGRYIGLTMRHRKALMTRAGMEGVAYLTR